MRIALILLGIALPLIEIALLIKIGGWIGFWWTLALILVTAMLGVAVVMEHGLTAAVRLQRAMLSGEAPLQTMLEGALVVASGVLLVTPGVLADVLGLCLLVPPARRLAARAIGRWFLVLDPAERPTAEPAGDRRFGGSGPHGGFDSGPRAGAGRRSGPGPVIDGEFTRLDERTVDPDRQGDDGQRRGGSR